MNPQTQETLDGLSWYKVPVTFANTFVSHNMEAHPISVFSAITKSVNKQVFPARLGRDAIPAVFFHIVGKSFTYRIHNKDIIAVKFLFTGCTRETVARWIDCLRNYLDNPDTGKNYSIATIGEIEERTFEKLASETRFEKTEGEVCIDFQSPFPLKPEKGHDRTYIGKQAFVVSFEKRLAKLFGVSIPYSSDTDNFSVVPIYWKYAEIRRQSMSEPGTTQYINGCVGPLYLKGIFKDFVPFLLLGSELHAGQKVSDSQGYYLIRGDSPSYFEKFFPDKRALHSVIHDTIERYDVASESIHNADPPLPGEEGYAEKLLDDLRHFSPTPNIAFTVKKRDGSERMVEQLHLRDLIVHHYLLKTISDPFDRLFEEGTIGFRKGYSRTKAVDMIQRAMFEGFRYVIESDIEDFFSSVDIQILDRLLVSVIPEKDNSIRELILKCVKNGYVLNGTYHERAKGLAQGSPLSPVLANLYLDSFDETVESWNVRMVRYADDFIILTRTKEEAENILSRTESVLSGIGLKIKMEKTSIKFIEDGFNFLGVRFEGTESKIGPEQDLHLMRKPLYITEPFLFLGLNGEAIDIYKSRQVIETIPLRRLSEIMVMEKASFSTALLKKCTEDNIPLTITLNSGYYITTIKPDSRKYYDLAFQHARKHYALSDIEALSIAKEFAAGKVGNYISLFKQRYSAGMNIAIKRLDRAVSDIQAAANVDEVRGFEGAIAKEVYGMLNDLIDDDTFHIKTRERKNPDRINSLINFGHYLLFSRINATLRSVGLNPYLGFLHSSENNYESLACDIEELFRARIDRFLIRTLNLKTITADDFYETSRGMFLKKDAVVKFLQQFESEMEKKSSRSELSLKETIYFQVNVFRKWILDNSSLWFYNWEV